jgi:hypothetical protein
MDCVAKDLPLPLNLDSPVGILGIPNDTVVFCPATPSYGDESAVVAERNQLHVRDVGVVNAGLPVFVEQWVEVVLLGLLRGMESAACGI